MEIEKRNYKGDPNIGFYGIVTPSFAILPKDMKAEFFGDKIINTRIGGVELIGLFSAGNTNGVILPEVARRREIEALKEAKIDFKVLDTNYTAFGNLILCNDQGCIISKNLEDEREEIKEILDVDVRTGTVAGLDIPGSCGVATNKGVLLHRDASEKEIEKVEDTLGVEAGTGSINFGSPYVRSGILVNSRGALIGDKTTGPETVRIQEALKLYD